VSAPAHLPFATVWNGDDAIESVTFGQFLGMARAEGARLKAQGVRPGAPLVLVLPQGLPLMAAFAGAMLVGAVPSILAYPNFKVDPDKYRHGLTGVVRNLNASGVVLDDEFPAALLHELTTDQQVRVLRMGHGNDVDLSAASVPTDPQQLAFIQHSAGTTGLQKGVALSHWAVIRHLNHLAAALRVTRHDSVYSWLPLYHDMGLIACFMLPLVFHLPVVMQSPTDWVMRPSTALALIDRYRCSLAWMPNFAFQFLARRVPAAVRAKYDLSSLRAVVNCSEPVRDQSMNEFHDAYAGCGLRREALSASYALAENVFAVTQSDGEPATVSIDGAQLTGAHMAIEVPNGGAQSTTLVSSGRSLPHTQVRILSNDGGACPDGHVGEIVIQSETLFAGYYNRPDLTAAVLRDGWYWTGDLGFLRHGELYVIGRKHDLIVAAGKNFYPQDIEDIVCRHPCIHDGRAVAFGVFNADVGTDEIVVIAEVNHEADLENGTAIEQAVRTSVVAELGVSVRRVVLKPPKWIVKSTAGKPARSSTREKLRAEEHDSAEREDGRR
jgi:fatty-acyl-CoA synthase